MKMVDVGSKPPTERVATATAAVRLKPQTMARIRRGQIEKGDVLAAARLAGIMATKRTPDLIPLCHPISLSGAEVAVEVGRRGLEIRATTRTVDRTGVEMEALMAASVAALTAYDMLKSIDRGIVIERLQLETKVGGRSGSWVRGPTQKRAPRRRGAEVK